MGDGQRFVYVEARAIGEGNGEPLVSFDSVFVTAASEDEAYILGPAAILRQRADKGDPFLHGYGELLNDYVVLLPTIY